MDQDIRIVVDLGNTRMKWGRVDPAGELRDTAATPLDDPAAWADAVAAWAKPGAAIRWAVSTVSPPVAGRLESWIGTRPTRSIRWFRSAADVPVRHALATPETTGADRALAVWMAATLREGQGPGRLISCGTAVTVERIDGDGRWQGGAIAPGFGLMARSLHLGTAQLPEIAADEGNPPPAWGDSTRPALAAGVFWGVVGGIRELLARQEEPGSDPWRIWTGGDAATLSAQLPAARSVVLPHLVLSALGRVGFDDPA